MNAPPLLEAADVSVVYPTPRGPITAVDRVSLTLAAGESLAILGRSGSGKSTLLATLAGLCLPTAGEVRLRGRSWSMLSPRETQAARAGVIGLVLQDAGLLPGLRAFDNVLLPLVVAGRSPAAAAARVEELLARVGLSDRWDAYPAELSGGQQRRIAVARALACEPPLVFADEPTADLDAAAAREVIALLAELSERGRTTIVVVTHDPSVAAVATRRFWMERGRCEADGSDLGAAGLAPVLPTAFRPSAIDAFEPPPAALVPARPSLSIAASLRAWLPFLAGAAVAIAAVGLVDALVARRQSARVEAVRVRRRLVEEMALQDLRADLDDVAVTDDFRCRATLFLENFRPARPLHVLGPRVDVAIQRDGRWESVPLEPAAEDAPAIRTVAAGRSLIPVAFKVPALTYDRLLPGYLHVRFGASFVISDRADGTGDLFDRDDAYYVYLRDPRLTEVEVREANGWGPKATVPVWIGMPAH